MMVIGRAVRRTLDTLYKLSGMLAALFLFAILTLVVLQMTARWSGEIITGAPDYTGYCMAASSFLALSYALNNGSHIRVSLLLNALGRFRKWGEVWCFVVGSFFSCFFAYYAIKLTRDSYRFNDISQGQDTSALWIPQMAMCIGLVIFAIAMLDHLITLLLTGKDNIGSDALDRQAE